MTTISEKRKKWERKEETFRLSENFWSWKQICEVLSRTQSFYQFPMYVSCVLQTRFLEPLSVPFDQKTLPIICFQTIGHPARIHWCRSGVFIVNFEHISFLVLVCLLLTFSKEMPTGEAFMHSFKFLKS